MLLSDPFIAATIVGAGVVGWRAGASVSPRSRRSQHERRLRGAIGALAGLAIALCAGAALAQIGSLRPTLRDSAVLGAFVPAAEKPKQLFDGEARRVAAAIGASRTTRRAARSIVRLVGISCGQVHSGTGWIGGDGIIVTNAHVVAGERDMLAQVRGRGRGAAATPIWYEPASDIALLRAPALEGIPHLRLSDAPITRGTPAAVLGFPLGRRLKILDARLDSLVDTPGGIPVGTADRTSSTLYLGPVVRLQTRSQPGSSGSPVLDDRARVVATVFAAAGLDTLAVPNDAVRDALGRARDPVDTGSCR